MKQSDVSGWSFSYSLTTIQLQQDLSGNFFWDDLTDRSNRQNDMWSPLPNEVYRAAEREMGKGVLLKLSSASLLTSVTTTPCSVQDVTQGTCQKGL